MSSQARRLVAAVALVTLVAACGGGSAATATPATSTPATAAPASAAPADSAAPSTAGGGSADTAATCSTLKSLSSMDYAFGQSFGVIQSLDDSSKKLALEDVTSFAATAPAELQAAAADLVTVWTALVANAQAVKESDPHWVNANATLKAWQAAHCG